MAVTEETGGEVSSTAEATRLSTAPQAAAERPGRPTPGRLLVRGWRQLTSMRTALLLLFLLAIAAVPGSILPQRGLNQLKVDDYFRAHPQLAPVLDRLSLFDVFAAPWFAAIYLLLFGSLIGCLAPRIRLHVRAVRRQPPAAPRHLDRLPESASFAGAGEPAALAEQVRTTLRRLRWRTVLRTAGDGSVAVSAEKGYARETGNIVFHVALVALLAGIAMGGLWGWKGTVIVPAGGGFCNTVSAYDSFRPGRLVNGDHLPPFCVDVDSFTATYRPDGEPASFAAKIRYGGAAGDPTSTANLSVNHPLRHDGTRTYLLSHGYAPKITVTDPSGQVFRTQPIFLPSDPSLTSSGVVKLADARPTQIGIQGVFVPTRIPGDKIGIHSAFPAAENPALSVVVYEGNLGTGNGIPQSVYSLDQGQLDNGQLKMAKKAGGGAARALLTPGTSVRLADGTAIRFDGYTEWTSLQVARDPGQYVVLVAAMAMLAGLLLSLRVRRRRIWFRFAPATTDEPGPADEGTGARRTVIRAGGLSRTDPDTFAQEFARVLTVVRDPSPADRQVLGS